METVGTPVLWAGFIGFVLLMLALDLGVFHRKAHSVRAREALVWSLVWIGMAVAFGAFVWWRFGADRGLEYFAGYVIEKSLSVDNIFVFVILFSSLGIPAQHQHRVLFWGILTALVLRAVMIFAGTAVLSRFHWVIYVFGGFLIFTGIRLFLHRSAESDPAKGWPMRLARRIVPLTPALHGQRFFTVENGRRVATPLFLALLLVEISDVIFAVDSIPAIFAVTTDPFIVFTSNIFAILGLRSLFFLLAGLVDRFAYLKIGLSAVLVVVGVKMMIADIVKIPPAVSLLIIVLLLGASMLASWLRPPTTAPPGHRPGGGEPPAPAHPPR